MQGEAAPVSRQWSLVAGLRLRLRKHVVLSRQDMRGALWYVFQDPASGRTFRFSPEAYFIIASLDGSRTLADIRDRANRRFGDEAPTPDEIVRLFQQLHSADALQGDIPPDLDELARRAHNAKKVLVTQKLRSPLSVRIPFGDPDRFLRALQPLGQFLFSPVGLAVWLVVVGYCAIEAGAHWSELSGNVIDRVLGIDNLPIMTVAFVIAKFVHECGHGLAVKRWGGEVHETGIMFLVLAPVPYVDASSSSGFRSKWQRAAVGAAGVYVELLLAAFALQVWLSIEPGFVRSVAFNIMFIASITTVLFNANPLLRYDGYYVLGDLLEIPNLGARANRYLGYVVQRSLLGVRVAKPHLAPGEAGWLIPYAVASFFYRLFVAGMIALFLAQKYFILGVLLALSVVANSVVFPCYKAVRFLLTAPGLAGRRGRAVLVSATALASVAALLFLVPVPLTTSAEGVVWPPDKAEITAGTDGYVEQLLASDGQDVCPGCALVRLSDPDLSARIEMLQARRRALLARYQLEYRESMVKAQLTQNEIDHVEAQLAEERDRAARLTVQSPLAARFVPASPPQDMSGRYVRRGAVIGYAARSDELIVRAIVRQDDVGLITSSLERVSLRIAGSLASLRTGIIERAVPSATDRLPSLALSTAGGGTISVDPQNGREMRSLQKHYEFQIAFNGQRDAIWMGQRAHIQFVHGYEPIGIQLARRARQLFLRQLNV